jgi:hypothetical protein
MMMMGQRTKGLLTQRSYINARRVFHVGHSSSNSKSDLLVHGRANCALFIDDLGIVKETLLKGLFNTGHLGHQGLYREAGLLSLGWDFYAQLFGGSAIFEETCDNGVGDGVSVDCAGDCVRHGCQPALARSRSGFLALALHDTARMDLLTDVRDRMVYDLTCFSLWYLPVLDLLLGLLFLLLFGVSKSNRDERNHGLMYCEKCKQISQDDV